MCRQGVSITKCAGATAANETRRERGHCDATVGAVLTGKGDRCIAGTLFCYSIVLRKRCTRHRAIHLLARRFLALSSKLVPVTPIQRIPALGDSHGAQVTYRFLLIRKRVPWVAWWCGRRSSSDRSQRWRAGTMGGTRARSWSKVDVPTGIKRAGQHSAKFWSRARAVGVLCLCFALGWVSLVYLSSSAASSRHGTDEVHGAAERAGLGEEITIAHNVLYASVAHPESSGGRTSGTTAGEVIHRKLQLPMPIAVGGTVAASGARALAVFMIESGCSNPFNAITDAMDATGARMPQDAGLRFRLERLGGNTLDYGDWLDQPSDEATPGSHVRLRAKTALPDAMKSDLEKLLGEDGAARALDEPDMAFADEPYRKEKVCWGFKETHMLHRLPLLDRAFPRGWSLFHVVRDVRDLVVSDVYDQLRTGAALLPGARFLNTTTRTNPLDYVQAFCESDTGTPTSREAAWESFFDLAAEGRTGREARGAREALYRIEGLVDLWQTVATQARVWAEARLKAAVSGDKASFGYVLLRMEGMSTGSMDTFSAVQDNNAVRQVRRGLRALFGNVDVELAEQLNGELLVWLNEGSPAIGRDFAVPTFYRGENMTAGMTIPEGHWPEGMGPTRPGWQGPGTGTGGGHSRGGTGRGHGNGGGGGGSRLRARVLQGGGGPRRPVHGPAATGLDDDLVDDDFGRNGDFYDDELRGSAVGDDDDEFVHVAVGGNHEEFVPTQHYGKWRDCAPGFIQHVEARAYDTMLRFGYSPVYYNPPGSDDDASASAEDETAGDADGLSAGSHSSRRV